MQIVEPLEDRIAPATFSFTDVDGDTVTITTSKGSDAALEDAAERDMGQLETLDFSNLTEFAGTSVKIAVTELGAMGDGLVNVGFIDATGIDLGTVEVAGDLGKLTVGDANHGNGSVKSVKVQSVGVFGTNTGAPDLNWLMLGSTSSFIVNTDVEGAKLEWNNPTANQKISVGSVWIGGNLAGGNAAGTGSIFVSGTGTGLAELKSLSIGGSLVGTGYERTGSVIVGTYDAGPYDPITSGKIGSVFVGKNLEGQNFDETGSIIATAGIGDVKVVGYLGGAMGDYSGSIYSNGSLGAVKIGGSLYGGGGTTSGTVYSETGIKSVSVSGGLSGGAGAISGSVFSDSGAIGSVSVGAYMGGGDGVYSGTIRGGGGLGNVFIGGEILGGVGGYSGSISVGGAQKIGTVTVNGSIEGGAGERSGFIEGHTIGAIAISGSLYGDDGMHSGAIIATNNIASLTIGGNVEGGAGFGSGRILTYNEANKASVKFITIGGSLIGGGATSAEMFSGSITVKGKIGTLAIGGGVTGGNGDYSGSISRYMVDGDTGGSLTIGKLTIGSTVWGGAGFRSAFVNAFASTTVIGGDILGGTGEESGRVFLQGTSKQISLLGGIVGDMGIRSGTLQFNTTGSLLVGVGGEGASVAGGAGFLAGAVLGDSVKSGTIISSVSGGSGEYTGLVEITTINMLTVGGNVDGGSASNTGRIVGTTIAGKLTVEGSLGGSNNYSRNGGVEFGNANSIEIGGGIYGGNNTGMTNISESGFVRVDGTLKSIIVGGDILGGRVDNATTDISLGGIRAGILGSVVVKGSVIGNDSGDHLQPVYITGQGNSALTKGKNLAISSVNIQGDVSGAWILGGYSTNSTAINGDGGTGGGNAQLGTITIGGGFDNSSIATGVSDNGGDWADGNNALLSKPAGSTLVASIAKIVINGPLSATMQNGIAAERILSLTLGSMNVPVAPGSQFFALGPGNVFDVEQIPA